MNRSVYWLIGSLLGSGCASTKLYPTAPRPSAGTTSPSLITIERDKSSFGGGAACIVSDNGQAVGQLGPGGTLKWERDPGYMALHVQSDIAYVEPKDSTVEDVTHPGETRSYFVPGLAFTMGSVKGFRCQPQQPPASPMEIATANPLSPLNVAKRIATQWPKLQVGQSMKGVKAIVSAISDDFADTMSFAMTGQGAGYSMSDSNFRHVYVFDNPSAIDILVDAELIASTASSPRTVEMKLMFDNAGKLSDWTPKTTAQIAAIKQEKERQRALVAEASQKLSVQKSAAAWQEAVNAPSEDAWLGFIVKYTDSPKVDEAIAQLKSHKAFRVGDVIPWGTFGGMNWSQPRDDGFSNFRALSAERVIITNLDELTFNCTAESEFYAGDWVKLNKVMCKGHLVATTDGLRVSKGLALISLIK